MRSGNRKGDEAREEQSQQDSASKVGPPKRGQKGKNKKIKKKYQDQDEEERQMRMELLQVS